MYFKLTDIGQLEGFDFGKYRGLFTSQRLDRNTIPSNLFIYDVRESDTGHLRTVEPRVIVNHGGTLITNKPVVFSPGKDYYTLNNWTFTGDAIEFKDILDWFDKYGKEPPLTKIRRVKKRPAAILT